MAVRRVNPYAVKLHRTYDVAELAICCRVHKNTVHHWRTEGLAPIDGAKPILFLGSTVREFLKKRSANRKHPCSPGELYCFRCRRPRRPALAFAEYVPLTAKAGNIRAICESCETIMHRRVSLAALDDAMPSVQVQFAEGPLRLMGSTSTSLNCDFKRQNAA